MRMQGASVAQQAPRHGRGLWLLLLLVVAALPAFAKDKPLTAFFRETWTTRQGLPHNQVNAIAQTPDGYLWFGTWEGLVRYDGLEFHVFDRRNTPALLDNGIRSVHATPDGTIVVGTSRGGVSIKRGDAWRHLGMADGLAQDEIMDALYDRAGRLWVATENSGISVVQANGKVVHHDTGDGLPSDVAYSLLEDRDGAMWAATAAGVVRFADGGMRRFGVESGLPDAPAFHFLLDAKGVLYVGTERGVYRLAGERFVPLSPLLPQDGVPSLAIDTAGNLWLGTINNGLLRLAKSGVDRFSSQRGLPNNRVAALMVDREGSIWAGTNGGLLRLSDAPFSTWNGDQGLSDDYVRALAEGRDGSLWIGTSRGLNRIRDGRVVASYTSADGLPSDSILSLLEDRDGSLWAGTYTSGVLRLRDGKVVAHYDNASGMPGSNQVRALAQAPDGTLWIGTTRGLIRMRNGKYRLFGAKDGLPREFIMALHLAKDGSLWVGTANGAARIVGDRVQAIDAGKVGDAQDVFDFAEDPDGTIWMASDRGLLRYRAGKLAVLGLAQGLPIDTLFAVVDDGLGSFWLTSNRGVLRARRSDVEAVLDGRRKSLVVDHFSEADGLASAQCNGGAGPSALLDRHGKLWVATAGGAAVLDPAALRNYQRHVPPVVVEQVFANDAPVASGGSLELPAGTRKLEFHYASPSFRMPRFLRYRYKLEGVDHDWIDRGNQRVAQYTNLGPGHYRFLIGVSAPSLGQGWEATRATAIDVDIAPLLWQRGWFQAALVALTALLVVVLYRWRLRHLRQRAEQLEAIVDQRTSDLREQAERLLLADQEKSALLAKLREQAEAFERQAREDALTGLANRRSINEELARAFGEAVRDGAPLCFALFDLDHFKRINDGYSHLSGDRALVEAGKVLQREVDGLGRIARWGGEEFAVLFEGVGLGQARACCERVREAVERMDCAAFAPGWRMTVSGGVAERTGLAYYEKLVSRADDLLYEAKRNGRNRICG
jgi:diguanylate cyclase (GGDEF)-like protein